MGNNNDKHYGADHHHSHDDMDVQHLPQPTRRKRQTTTQYYDGSLVPDYHNEEDNDNNDDNNRNVSYDYHTTFTFEFKYQLHLIKQGDLVWVSKSKGLKKKNKKKHQYNEITNSDDGNGEADDDGNNEEQHSNDDNNGSAQQQEQDVEVVDNNDEQQEQRQRTGGELFLRARVLQCGAEEDGDDNETHGTHRRDRVLVQYPKGSTYHVRHDLITPIFDRSRQVQQTATTRQATAPSGIVVAINETHEYRRYCHIHTTSDDTFLEIGCAFGDTCERIQCSFEESNGSSSSRRVLGVDKSPESIAIAQERFPNCNFVVVEDVLEHPEELKQVCDSHLITPPTVVAIDINGSRDLPAVLQCIQIVMNLWNTYDKEVTLPTPRLIIVKSRTLVAELEKREYTNIIRHNVQN